MKNKLKSKVNNFILFIKEVLCFICGICCYLVSSKSKKDTELLSRQLHSLNSFTQVHTIHQTNNNKILLKMLWKNIEFHESWKYIIIFSHFCDCYSYSKNICEKFHKKILKSSPENREHLTQQGPKMSPNSPPLEIIYC